MKTRVTLTIALAAGMAVLPALSRAASNSVVPTPLDLLTKLGSGAYDASAHASRLQSIARSTYLDWEADAAALNDLKADINSMGQALSQLEQVRESATPEERQACDRAFPLLKLMADNSNAAYAFLNQDHGRFWKPGYQKMVANLAGEASQLKSSLGMYVKLANTRAREKHLETQLGMEAGS